MKGKDLHLLGMEDLCLINPSFDSGGNGGHREDHRGNLLIYSKRKLINEVEFLLDSSLEQKILEVGDVLLESIVGNTILFLEGCLHEL